MQSNKVDIIIFGGQSNMQGQTESLPEDNMPIQGTFEYRFISDELTSLQHPVGEDLFGGIGCLGAHKGNGSLVPSFCRSYVEKTNRTVVAVHVAKGSTTLGEWLHGTQLSYFARRKIASAIKKVKETYEVANIYYVWLQGESDALIHTKKDEYYERIIAYKEELKKEFGINKFGIIKVGYFLDYGSWNFLNPDDTNEAIISYNEAIMQAQEHAVKEDKDFIMLTRICADLSKASDYMNPEAPGHYNNKAMEIIGVEAGRTLGGINK